MRKKIIAGAIAGALALNVAGAAAFADRDRDEMDFPQPEMGEMTERGESPENGFFGGPGLPFGGPGGPGGPGGDGPGGKGGEKVWEMEYLIENTDISLDEAEDIAREQTSGRVLESKLHSEGGYPAYEVKVIGEEGYVNKYKLDAQSGDIYEREIEGSEKAYEAQYLTDYAEISRDEAEEIATEQSPGRVVENKLTEKHGFAVHEVETFEDGTLSEVLIEAQSGEIVGYKMEGGQTFSQDNFQRN